MYEPSHFKVEDRAALQAVMRAHPLGALTAVDKISVLNGVNGYGESASQEMAALVKSCGLGQSA
jgi:predicted FMN-binding regulatory protein PaiB